MKAAKGKLIEQEMLSEAIPFDVNMETGLGQAIQAVGAKQFVFNPNSDTSKYAIGIEQGIQRHASAIFIRSILPSEVSTQIDKAAAQGIKIGGGQWLECGVEPGSPGWPTSWPKGVSFATDQCYGVDGRDMADFTIANSNGHANVAIIYPPDVPYIAKATVNGLETEFKTLCPGCKYQLVPEPVADWSQIYTLVQSVLRKDPSIDYVIPIYDAMALYAVPGIHAAGDASRVKVVTSNATPAVMKLLAAHNVVAADVGQAAVWQGWGQADQIFRALAGLKPVPNINVPERTFDAANIGGVKLEAQESTWYNGTDDYVDHYKKLWGAKQ